MCCQQRVSAKHVPAMRNASRAALLGRSMQLVERWNSAPTHDWSPAIGTALKAGYRWLDVYCGGCRQVNLISRRSISIRTHVSRA
jgi:hypothetical protein